MQKQTDLQRFDVLFSAVKRLQVNSPLNIQKNIKIVVYSCWAHMMNIDSTGDGGTPQGICFAGLRWMLSVDFSLSYALTVNSVRGISKPKRVAYPRTDQKLQKWIIIFSWYWLSAFISIALKVMKYGSYDTKYCWRNKLFKFLNFQLLNVLCERLSFATCSWPATKMYTNKRTHINHPNLVYGADLKSLYPTLVNVGCTPKEWLAFRGNRIPLAMGTHVLHGVPGGNRSQKCQDVIYCRYITWSIQNSMAILFCEKVVWSF